MGHYLSDMETNEEYYHRTVLGPMRDALETYVKERRRGLVHTIEWHTKMAKNLKALKDAGYDTDYITRGMEIPCPPEE